MTNIGKQLYDLPTDWISNLEIELWYSLLIHNGIIMALKSVYQCLFISSKKGLHNLSRKHMQFISYKQVKILLFNHPILFNMKNH